MSLADLVAQLQQTLPRVDLKDTLLPNLDRLRLHLLDPATLEGPLSHEEAQAVVAEPAYWCFCWASGRVLAEYLLRNPVFVRNKTVIDVGSGSGIVAIAAALAGASQVTAIDTDPIARMAIATNAKLNHVTIGIEHSLEGLRSDVVTAADIFYDRDNLSLLPIFTGMSEEVLLADSRIKDLKAPGFSMCHQQESRTWPDLQEYEEFNQVKLYRAGKHSFAGMFKSGFSQ